MSAASTLRIAFCAAALALVASRAQAAQVLLKPDERPLVPREEKKKDDAKEAKPAGGSAGDVARPKAAILVEDAPVAPEAPPPPPHGEEKSAIAEIIRGHTPAVVRCYQNAVEDKPTLQGKLYVVFYIGSNGRVIGATTQGLNEPALTNCILPLVRKWEFEKPKSGGKLMVKYPFVFTPRPRE